MTEIPKPLVLIILDGWGISKRTENNALSVARTPVMDKYFNKYPHTIIKASGESVGLPPGQMGNSEVGHLNIGAGRIVYQDFSRINLAIKDGSFFENPVLLKAIERVRTNNSFLHLMGLLSDGGVHSHIDHIIALLKLVKDKGVRDVCLHMFLDGRDVPPKSAVSYIKDIEDEERKLGVGEIATISGRYYAMDRDRRWERTQLAYEAIVCGRGLYCKNAVEAVEEAYKRGEVDEFVKPSVILGFKEKARKEGFIKDEDSVVFFNFRPDRARQLSRSLIFKDFSEFDRDKNPPLPFFVSMTEYDETFPVEICFPPEQLKNILTDVLEVNGFKQLRIAETEKYAHVTFFFSGGDENIREGEERILIPSPKVPTYDKKPDMSAFEVTDRVIKEIDRDHFDVIMLNYANPDMVGHTGDMDAAIRAAETVDECVGRVVKKVISAGGEALITADHGNIEQMKDYSTHEPHTAHTSNEVPLIYVTERNIALKNGMKLADIAPTILEILKLEKPEEMTGETIIKTITGDR